MIATAWIVQSKTEAAEGKVAVNLRPRTSGAPGTAGTGGGNVSLVLDGADAVAYEPGRRVTVTLELDAAGA